MGPETVVDMKAHGWETFDHVADIGVRGFGATLEEAFANAARAMFSIMVEDLSSIVPRDRVTVSCQSFDLEGLLVAWLNALVAQADIHDMIFSDFGLDIQQTQITLKGWAAGLPWKEVPGGRGVEVKGATFSEVRVEPGPRGGWLAQCIVDV